MMQEFDPNQPEKNPFDGASLPPDFSVSDFEDAETHPDAKGIEDIPSDASLDLEGLISEVDVRATLGAINDNALGILHGFKEDPLSHDLPVEASYALEFLHMKVKDSVVDNNPDAIMALSNELIIKEGSLFEEALDYPAGDEIDQEKYLRILENLTSVTELISIWEMLKEQQKDISGTLYDRLSGSIADMRCYDLAEVIDRYFTKQ